MKGKKRRREPGYDDMLEDVRMDWKQKYRKLHACTVECRVSAHGRSNSRLKKRGWAFARYTGHFRRADIAKIEPYVLLHALASSRTAALAVGQARRRAAPIRLGSARWLQCQGKADYG